MIADSVSRTKPIESEWSLDQASFRWILNKVPDLQIDLFATGDNHKLPLYISPNLDPKAVTMDALSIDWDKWERIYLFPPVNLLMKVLPKLRQFKGKVALVAPWWPKSNWFPLLLELRLQPHMFPNLQLQQKVQNRVVSASSNLMNALRLWTS